MFRPSSSSGEMRLTSLLVSALSIVDINMTTRKALQVVQLLCIGSAISLD